MTAQNFYTDFDVENRGAEWEVSAWHETEEVEVRASIGFYDMLDRIAEANFGGDRYMATKRLLEMDFVEEKEWAILCFLDQMNN